MKKTLGERILWVDVLSISSLYKINCNKNKVDKVIYLNTYTFLEPYVNFFSRKVIGIPIQQMNFISQSDVRMEGMSLYDYIQKALAENLDGLIEYSKVEQRGKVFVSENSFNYEKYVQHIKELAYLKLYRSVSIFAMGDYVQCDKGSIFIFRSNSLDDFISHKNPNKHIIFEKHYSLLTRLIIKRSGYHFDKFIEQGLFRQKLQFFVKCLLGLLGEMLFIFSRRFEGQNNIGVDLIQVKHRADKLNDIFWLKDSGVDPKSVRGFLEVDYDSKSFELIKAIGIDLIATPGHFIRNPRRFFDLIKTTTVVGIGFWRYIALLSSLPCVLLKTRDNIDSWLDFAEIRYKIRVKYWGGIYNNLGIRILWTMADIDPEKLIKSQALEDVGAIYTGSHWSNYPSCEFINKKCYDLTLAWSSLFVDSHFKKHGNSKYQIVGYVADYLFLDLKSVKRNVHLKCEFTITYFDNSISPDLPLSVSMQKQIYRMLVCLLVKYDHIILQLKPKRFSEVSSILTIEPELLRFWKEDRVKLFCDRSGERITPSSVGANSDLTVGMGISTAAAECCFSGVVSFHADLTRYESNVFANNGLGKVVFRNVVDLELAIENQILGKGISIDECKELHKCLDSYQDGKVYLRVGSILKQVQQNFELGMSRIHAIEKVKI